ncbi:MAG: hypothetical protein IJF37_08975 [Lachnospiraceae bacterium]|nr:hypothetical protein [Lachnospiraceae bacterium]
MATTNAGNGNGNDSRPRYNRNVDGEKREKKIYTTDNRKSDRPRGDFKRQGNGESRGNGDFRPKRDGEYKPRNNGEFKSRNNNGSFEKKSNGGYTNSFNNRGFDKDKDEDTPVVRRQKPKADSKPKEPQQDKFDIMSRLEKEKKAMKKKHTESRGDSKPSRHVAKPKRSGNIDWTREYENDSYDDDDLDMYL